MVISMDKSEPEDSSPSLPDSGLVTAALSGDDNNVRALLSGFDRKRSPHDMDAAVALLSQRNGENDYHCLRPIIEYQTASLPFQVSDWVDEAFKDMSFKKEEACKRMNIVLKGYTPRPITPADIDDRQKLKDILTPAIAKKYAEIDNKIPVLMVDLEECYTNEFANQAAFKEYKGYFAKLLAATGITGDGELRTNVARAVLESDTFIKGAITQDPNVLEAMHRMLTNEADLSIKYHAWDKGAKDPDNIDLRNSPLYSVLRSIKTEADEEMVQKVCKDSLLHSLTNADNFLQHGADQNFKIIASKVAKRPEFVSEVLSAIGNIDIQEQGQAEKIGARIAALVAKATPEDKIKLYKNLAAHNTLHILHAFEGASGVKNEHGPIKAEALYAASGVDKSAVERETAVARSLSNVNHLLDKNAFKEDDYFHALEKAMAAVKPDHFVDIIKELKTKLPDQLEEIVNRDTSDGSTLFVKATELESEKLVSRFGLALHSAGAKPRVDSHANDPMSNLAAKGMENSRLYVEMRKRLENTIDLGFIKDQEKAKLLGRMEAGMEILERLKGLPTEQATLLLQFALGGGAPAAAPAPALGDHTAKEQQRRITTNESGTGTPGGTP